MEKLEIIIENLRQDRFINFCSCVSTKSLMIHSLIGFDSWFFMKLATYTTGFYTSEQRINDLEPLYTVIRFTYSGEKELGYVINKGKEVYNG